MFLCCEPHFEFFSLILIFLLQDASAIFSTNMQHFGSYVHIHRGLNCLYLDTKNLLPNFISKYFSRQFCFMPVITSVMLPCKYCGNNNPKGINNTFNRKTNYSLPCPYQEANMIKSVKLTGQLQKEFEDVFNKIGCFDDTICLHVELDSRLPDATAVHSL